MNRIDKMLELLRERGWYQGDYHNPKGLSCCVLGAHSLLEGYYGNHDRHTNLIGKVLAEQYQDRLDPSELFQAEQVGCMWVLIPKFNDHPDTTFSDVELVLEKASLRFEESA